MIGAIVVTLIVYAIVASYMGIVNRMLRADEYWSESNQVKPPWKPHHRCLPVWRPPRPTHRPGSATIAAPGKFPSSAELPDSRAV
jgi:hypothetical protein